MGIATDIVIQQRHRQNKGTGDEAAAAEIEAQEEDLEDVREALRGRLYQPVKLVKKATENDDAGLAALSSTGNRRGNRPSGQKNKVHPDQAGLLANGPNALSNSWDTALKRSKSIMQHVQTLAMPSLRSNPPSFSNGKWESINGNLAMMMKTPASMELEPSHDLQPQTPSPVRAKRGLPTDPKKDRRTLDLAVSGDGSKIVACDTQGSTWVSDAVTGRMLCHMRGHKRARVTTCAISNRGGVVAAGGSDGKVVVWDCRKKSASYLLGGPEDKAPSHREERVNGVPFGVSTVEICPNGMFLASIGQDGNLFIHRLCNQLGGVDSINPEDPIQPELLLQRPTGRAPADNAYYSDAALHHMAFSPDGRYCAACGAEGRFLLVELSNMRVHEFPVCEEDEGLLFVAFDRELSRDTGIMSRHLALCSTKGTVYVYDIDGILKNQEKCDRMTPFKVPGGSVTACAFEPPVKGRQHRRRVAAGSEGGGLMIFDLEEKTQITAINAGAFGTETVHTLTYSPDAKFLLAAGLGSKALVIDADTHSVLHMLTPGSPSDPITDVASRSADKATMALAEAEKRKADVRYIMAAAMTPDGNHVILGLGAKSNGAVIQFDITPGAGSALLQIDDDELGESYSSYAAFLGNTLDAICSTGGGHLQIWDTSTSTLKKHIELRGIDDDGTVISWEFNQESGLVVVRTDDDFVTVWNVGPAMSTTTTTMTEDPVRFPVVVQHSFKEKMEGCTALPSPCGRFLLKCGQHGRSTLCQLNGQEVGVVQASDDMKQGYHTFKFSGDGCLLVGASMLSPRLDVWHTESSPPKHISTLEPMDADSYRKHDDSCFVDFSIFHVPLGSQSNVGAITGAGNAAGGWWVSAVGSPIPRGSEPLAGGIYWWALVQPTPRTITSASFTHYPDHCPNGCSFSPNGRLLATYGTDGRVLVWEIKGKGRTGRVMGNRKLHKGGVKSVCWSKDSTMLLSNGSPGDANGGLECLYVSNVTSGRVTAVLPARPTCSFSMAAFSDDGTLVLAPHKVGSVAVYNRSGAHDVAPTDASFFYRPDAEQPGFFTEELTNAMIRFPLMGNHVTDQGHNLVTDIVRMRDYSSLEAALNVQPANVPIYSYRAGRWDGETWQPQDAMSIAINNHDQGMLYDLLMAMADGKVTPESWESFLGRQKDSQDGIWGTLCSNFPSLVLVFLTRLSASELDNDVQYIDHKGKLEDDGLYVAGSSVYMPGMVESFWQRKTRVIPSMMKKATTWTGDRIRKMTGGEEDTPIVPQTCIARRVDIPWIARAGEHGFLKAIVESDCPAAVYGTPVVRAVLQFKWKAYGMRKFATECIFHFLQLLTFTGFALLYSDMGATSCRDKAPQTIFDTLFQMHAEQSGENTKVLVAMVFQIISFIIALRNMGRELLQMKNVGLWKYFSSDPWNTLDIISYTAIFCILPINVFVAPTCTYDFSGYDMSVCGDDSLPDGSGVTADMCSSWINESWHTTGLDELIAVEVTFLWMECMNFATGFRGTGALVRIFVRTISDISWFMALQVVLMIGFGAGFAVLFSNQQQCDDGPYCIFNEAYDTIVFSFTSMFGLLLGDIGVLDFFNSPHPAWSVLMMILYEFLVFVVLFNMLIALMADTFVEVKESEEVEFLKGRADIICSQEETMTKKKLSDIKLFPRYLHTLMRKEDVEFQMALQSIQGGQDKTRVQLLKIQGDLEEQHKEMLKELKKESKAITDEMKARMRSSASSGAHSKSSRSGPSKGASSAVLPPTIQESGASSSAPMAP